MNFISINLMSINIITTIIVILCTKSYYFIILTLIELEIDRRFKNDASHQ